MGTRASTLAKFAINARFGTFTVIGPVIYRETSSGAERKRRPYCTVRCDCGNEGEMLCFNLSRAVMCKSCGGRKVATIHGNSRRELFNRYKAMIHRCSNPKLKCYHRYGGRGIRVCEEWSNDYRRFEEWAMSNGYAPGLEIDRKDNDGPYSPENSRWVPHKINCLNTRQNVRVTAFGETKTLTEWAEDQRCSGKFSTFYARLKRGWPAEKALTHPVRMARK